MDEAPKPPPLEYARPKVRRMSPAVATVAAILSFMAGAPIAAMGVGILPVVSGWRDPELYRCVTSIVIGGTLCGLGFYFQRRDV